MPPPSSSPGTPRAGGRQILDEDLVRLSTLQNEHIKMLGTFHFALPDQLLAGHRRALRRPDDPAQRAFLSHYYRKAVPRLLP